MTYSPRRVQIGGPHDPIATFGRRGAAELVARVRGVAPRDRDRFLRVALDDIDPALAPTVEQNLVRLKAKGVRGDEALRRAIAGALSDGMVADLRRSATLSFPMQPLGAVRSVISKRGKRDAHKQWTATIGPLTFTGRGEFTTNAVVAYEKDGTKVRRNTGASRAVKGSLEPKFYHAWKFNIGGTMPKAIRDAIDKAVTQRMFVSKLGALKHNPMAAGKAAWQLVSKGKLPIAKTVIHGKAYGVVMTNVTPTQATFSIRREKSVLEALVGLWLWQFKLVMRAVEEVADAALQAADKLKGLACKAVGHELAEYAGAAAAASQGAPPQTGAAGVQVARGLCQGAPDEGMPPMPPSGRPRWMLPAAIAGAGVLGLLLLRR